MHVDDMTQEEAESWIPYFVNKIGDIDTSALETEAALEDLKDVVRQVESFGATVSTEVLELVTEVN